MSKSNRGYSILQPPGFCCCKRFHRRVRFYICKQMPKRLNPKRQAMSPHLTADWMCWSILWNEVAQ